MVIQPGDFTVNQNIPVKSAKVLCRPHKTYSLLSRKRSMCHGNGSYWALYYGGILLQNQCFQGQYICNTASNVTEHNSYLVLSMLTYTIGGTGPDFCGCHITVLYSSKLVWGPTDPLRDNDQADWDCSFIPCLVSAGLGPAS